MTDNHSHELGYEAARDELIAIVQRLETGGTSLEESLSLWERGEELARICQNWLDGARERLAAVQQGAADQSEADSSDAAGPEATNGSSEAM